MSDDFLWLESEMISQLLAVFPNMTLGEDSDGQLIVYTDTRLVGGQVVPYEEVTL